MHSVRILTHEIASKTDLTLDHILPRSRGGPDTADNAVLVCKTCNISKSDRRLYEWYTLDKRNQIPRTAEGKHLKLHTVHEHTKKKS